MARRDHKSGTFAIATGARVERRSDLRLSWQEANPALDRELTDLELAGPCDVRLYSSVNQARMPKATP